MDRKHEIEKYLMQLLQEEPEEITATSLKREYTNGFLAGQRKAYDECDDIARELSQIKSGCSKWLDEHDRKIRNDAIDEFKEKLLDLCSGGEECIDCVGGTCTKCIDNSVDYSSIVELADHMKDSNK